MPLALNTKQVFTVHLFSYFVNIYFAVL